MAHPEPAGCRVPRTTLWIGELESVAPVEDLTHEVADGNLIVTAGDFRLVLKNVDQPLDDRGMMRREWERRHRSDPMQR